MRFSPAKRLAANSCLSDAPILHCKARFSMKKEGVRHLAKELASEATLGNPWKRIGKGSSNF